jgi:hypothetical protein
MAESDQDRQARARDALCFLDTAKSIELPPDCKAAATGPIASWRPESDSHLDVCDQLLALLASQIRMLANRVNEFTTLDVRHRIYAGLLRLSRPEPDNKSSAIISPPRCTRKSPVASHAA